MWLYLRQSNFFEAENLKVLHIAPEQCFYPTFKKQKNADVSLETISKANHLFEGKLDPLMVTMSKYINKHKL